MLPLSLYVWGTKDVVYPILYNYLIRILSEQGMFVIHYLTETSLSKSLYYSRHSGCTIIIQYSVYMSYYGM